MATLTPSLNSITFTVNESVIVGYVYNEYIGTAFPNATICCYDETSKELAGTAISDVNGYFEIYVDSGTYFLVADAPGQTIGAVDNISPTP